MWALLVVLLLLQVLTLVLVGHPIGRAFLMDILDRIFWSFGLLLRRLGLACLGMAFHIWNHESMDSLRGPVPEDGGDNRDDSDSDSDSNSDNSGPPPPPPPPSAGAGVGACQKLSQKQSPTTESAPQMTDSEWIDLMVDISAMTTEQYSEWLQ